MFSSSHLILTRTLGTLGAVMLLEVDLLDFLGTGKDVKIISWCDWISGFSSEQITEESDSDWSGGPLDRITSSCESEEPLPWKWWCVEWLRLRLDREYFLQK